MDERMLRDIGLDRAQLLHAPRFGGAEAERRRRT